jgi:hypothetical protein
MAKYGNILTVFNADDHVKNQIETILINNMVVYLRLNDTFFVETTSKKNTADVIRDLNTLTIEFIFYHNHIADGSLIKTTGIDAATVQAIDGILFR